MRPKRVPPAGLPSMYASRAMCMRRASRKKGIQRALSGSADAGADQRVPARSRSTLAAWRAGGDQLGRVALDVLVMAPPSFSMKSMTRRSGSATWTCGTGRSERRVKFREHVAFDREARSLVTRSRLHRQMTPVLEPHDEA